MPLHTEDDEILDMDADEVEAEHGVPGAARRERGLQLDADTILDNIMPRSIDWRETVRRHPLSSVVTVALIGYLVGRTKGSAIMAGVTTGLSAALMRQLGDVFEGDFFDF